MINKQVNENLAVENSASLSEDSEHLIDETSFLLEARERLRNLDKTHRHLIVQRDPERFWPVLFRQNFDASKQSLTIRFAGEAGADAGGP